MSFFPSRVVSVGDTRLVATRTGEGSPLLSFNDPSVTSSDLLSRGVTVRTPLLPSSPPPPITVVRRLIDSDSHGPVLVTGRPDWTTNSPEVVSLVSL